MKKRSEDKIAKEKIAEEKIAEEKIAEEKIAEEKIAKEKIAKEKIVKDAKSEVSVSVDKNSPDNKNSVKRGVVFFFIFIIFILAALFGPLAYHKWQVQKEAEKNKYNGFDFNPLSNGETTFWVTQLDVGGQLYNIPFYYHPRDTENVILQNGTAARFLTPDKPPLIYITVPRDGGSRPVVGGVEISRLTGYKYGLLKIDTRSALQEPAAGVETPVVRCEDANVNMTVLSFEPSTQDLIVQDKSNPYCIHLFYKENDSIRVADRFAYGLLRIMPS